jgi:hypothetical protein
MSDVPIEAQLRGKPDPRKLKAAFARLPADDAASFLEALLAADGSRLSKDFRRLPKHRRLDMLLVLVGRLGPQTRESFAKRLTPGASGADRVLQRALHSMFSDAGDVYRKKILPALKKRSAPGFPMATMLFRSHNQRISDDNWCQFRRDGQLPEILGFDKKTGQNWMEIRATLSVHHPDAIYDFTRRVEVGAFVYVRQQVDPKTQKPLADDFWDGHFQPEHDDNRPLDKDEDPIPDNDHIYSIDGPGPSIPPTDHLTKITGWSKFEPHVSDFVWVMNATERLQVTISGIVRSQVIQKLEWYSITWLTRELIGYSKRDGLPAFENWKRKPYKSAILPGRIADLKRMTQNTYGPILPHFPFE